MLDHADFATLPNIYATEPAVKFPIITSPPTPDRNPLRDVEVLETSIPDFPLLKVPSSNTVVSNTTGPLPAPHPAYWVRTLSSLSCPASLSSHEWRLFTTDLERAAALMRRKAIVVAVGITTLDPVIPETVLLGICRYLAAQDVKSRFRNQVYLDQRRKRESVPSVVAKWNEKWADSGISVALDVKSTRMNKERVRKVKFLMIVEDVQAEAVEDQGGNELEADVYYGGYLAV